VAAVLSSGANGILLIRPQIGSNINNDEGVKITTPTTGDILQLQASGLWENKSRLAAGLVTGSGTTNYLAKFTAGGTVGNSQVFDNGTNVGIGTTSPSAKLDVNGDIYSNTRILADIFGGYSGSDVRLTTNTGGTANLLFQTANTERMRITSGGDIEIKKSDSRIRGGDASGRVILSNSDTSAYLIINGSSNGNSIALVTNQHIAFNVGASYSERMRIFSDGKVGINTSVNAGFRLDVNGSLRANTRVNFASLPTSSSGLVSGDLWRNGTVINIIP
jgi:hypothetical protein